MGEVELTQQDFKSATSAVASKAMRNELNALIEGIEDPNAKRAFEAEMSSFYHLFNRFLAEKAKGEKLCVQAETWLTPVIGTKFSRRRLIRCCRTLRCLRPRTRPS